MGTVVAVLLILQDTWFTGMVPLLCATDPGFAATAAITIGLNSGIMHCKHASSFSCCCCSIVVDDVTKLAKRLHAAKISSAASRVDDDDNEA